MNNEIQEYQGSLMTPEARITALKENIQIVQQVMRDVMRKDEHYGIIPGTQKPTLYKSGAEKLSFTFRMAPEFEITKTDFDGGHREYSVVCRLVSIETGKFLGSGVGSCSTLESKYRYRQASRKCPVCGHEAIIKGKPEYGGGWLCYKNKGGCGAKFETDDPVIVDQPVGRVDNEDIADVYNTILKMAKKRAFVDATLQVTSASDIFTQDVEDFAEPEKDVSPPEKTVNPPQKAQPAQRTDPPPPRGNGSKPPITQPIGQGEIIPKEFWSMSSEQKALVTPAGCRPVRVANGQWVMGKAA